MDGTDVSAHNPQEEEERGFQWTTRLHNLEKELYGDNLRGGENQDGIPLGIVLLWEIMAKRPSDLLGPDYASLFDVSGDLLGVGSSSTTFQHHLHKDVVLKVPTGDDDTHIKHEAEMLKLLGRHLHHVTIGPWWCCGTSNSASFPLPGSIYRNRACCCPPSGHPSCNSLEVW